MSKPVFTEADYWRIWYYLDPGINKNCEEIDRKLKEMGLTKGRATTINRLAWIASLLIGKKWNSKKLREWTWKHSTNERSGIRVLIEDILIKNGVDEDGKLTLKGLKTVFEG